MTIPSALLILASAARRPWQLMERVDLDVVAEPVAEPVVALVAAIAAIAAALNADPAAAPIARFVVASQALVERM